MLQSRRLLPTRCESSRTGYLAWLIRLALALLVALAGTPALAQRASISPAFGSTLPQATASQPYSMNFTGADGLPPYEFRSLGGMPPGLSLALRGALSGTPLEVGSFTLTVGFMDGNGREASGSYTLQVVAPTIVLSPATLPAGRVGTAYSQTITASGGTGPYEFAVRAGSLPAGVSLDSSGVLAGTVAGAGAFSFTITATDDNGFTGERAYAIGVDVDPAAVAGSFDARARDFVTARQQLLVRSIDLPGLHDRLRPAGARGLAGHAAGDAQALSFAASLADLGRTAAGAAADSLASSLAPPPFNIWIDGLVGWHAGSDAGSGSFGVTGVGADYLVNDRLLLGLALYGDWMNAGTAGGKTSGMGVLAGPYASIGLGDAATLDLSLLYGRSSNDISSELFGATYAGSFETSRWLAHARIEGLWQTDVLSIRPRAELSVASEAAAAYSVSGPVGDPVAIEGFTTTTLAASLGADLEVTHDLGNGLLLQPRLGFDIGIANAVPSAELRAGFELLGSDAWDFSGSIAAGLDGNGLGSVAVRGGLGVRF